MKSLVRTKNSIQEDIDSLEAYLHGLPEHLPSLPAFRSYRETLEDLREEQLVATILEERSIEAAMDLENGNVNSALEHFQKSASSISEELRLVESTNAIR